MAQEREDKSPGKPRGLRFQKVMPGKCSREAVTGQVLVASGEHQREGNYKAES